MDEKKEVNVEKLKELFLTEIDFREKWRNAVKQLQDLVQPATNHVEECCNFWNENFPNISEIIISFDKNKSFKIVKPKLEPATQEAYLPYGIDFSEITLVTTENSNVK